MTDNPILIAAAGIGGLAAALTLHQIGVPCVVVEAVRESGRRASTCACLVIAILWLVSAPASLLFFLLAGPRSSLSASAVR